MDADNAIKLLLTISFDHIKLTPYSVMRVNLAAQVLSSTMANVLLHYGGDHQLLLIIVKWLMGFLIAWMFVVGMNILGRGNRPCSIYQLK